MVPESRLVVPAVTQCFKDQPSEIPPTVFDRHTAVLLHLKVRMFGLSVLFSATSFCYILVDGSVLSVWGALQVLKMCYPKKKIKVMEGEKERF